MTTQMIIRINNEKKDMLNKLSKAEGKTTSRLLRDMIDNYIRERDMSAYIDDLWERISKKFNKKRYAENDIQRFIKESRKNK